MRLGLLRCDELSHNLVSVHGGYLDLFSKLFSRVDPSIELAEYNVVAGELPRDPAEQDAWLVSGSNASTYDDEPWIASLLDLLRDLDAARATTVGLCFGHQALAQALGGKVCRSDEGWGVGVQPAVLIGAEGWIPSSYLQFAIVYCHQDVVTILPDGARLIASAKHCPIAAFASGNHILGIQGHPEFSTNLAADLYAEMALTLGEETMVVAQNTLNDGTDRVDTARWILRFISSRKEIKEAAKLV
jgi:GMP synthase-like glutamine amidotransferase